MAALPHKIIVGVSPYIDRAFAEWKESAPDLNLICVPVVQDASYNFDLTTLSCHSPSSTTAFVAFDNQFLNLKRHELFLYLKKLGFQMPPLINVSAIVAAGVQISENVWIGPAVLIGSGTSIGANSVIGFGAAVHPEVKIGENVVIGDGTVVGRSCEIDPFAMIGSQVRLGEAVKIGRFCRLLRLGYYQASYAEGTFIEDRFEARILS